MSSYARGPCGYGVARSTDVVPSRTSHATGSVSSTQQPGAAPWIRDARG